MDINQFFESAFPTRLKTIRGPSINGYSFTSMWTVGKLNYYNQVSNLSLIWFSEVFGRGNLYLDLWECVVWKFRKVKNVIAIMFGLFWKSYNVL